MSVVGLILLFSIRVPKWFLLFLPIGLIGLCGLLFLEGYFFVKVKDVIFIPSLLLSLIVFIVLWLAMRGAFVKKILFGMIAVIYIFFCVYGFLYFSLLFYVKSTVKSEEIKECVPVVEYGDYKPHREFIGGYLILEYNGVENEVLIPEVQAKKLKGELPSCLSLILKEGGYRGYYIEKIEW